MRNIPYYILVVFGVVVGAEGAYSLATGHPFRKDTTPPTINSSVKSFPACFTTVIKPDIKVEEPGTLFWEKKTGLKVVKLYVGSDLVGEWYIPNIENENLKKYTLHKNDSYELKGPEFERRISSRYGPIKTVAEDFEGNVAIKVVEDYIPPHCFSGSASANKCDCPDPDLEGYKVIKIPSPKPNSLGSTE